MPWVTLHRACAVLRRGYLIGPLGFCCRNSLARHVLHDLRVYPKTWSWAGVSTAGYTHTPEETAPLARATIRSTTEARFSRRAVAARAGRAAGESCWWLNLLTQGFARASMPIRKTLGPRRKTRLQLGWQRWRLLRCLGTRWLSPLLLRPQVDGVVPEPAEVVVRRHFPPHSVEIAR